ncbi:MAG: BLUF domain-containing protein [Janthinobacterium lividum]
MEPELYRIVYCSRNLIAEQDEARDQNVDLEQILHTARENNKAVSVTGALLFNTEYFAQVLEGPRTAVEDIFERIQRDRRHSQVTVVDNGWAETRNFPDWAMAHVAQSPEVVPEGLANTLHVAMLRPHESGTEVLDLLKSLVVQD